MNYRRLCTLLAISCFLVSASALMAQRTITCSSNDMHRNFCDMGRARDARLVNQRSGSPCIRGNTWGIQGNSLWVDRGCRADFQLMGGGGHGPGPGPGYGSQLIRCESGNMNYRKCGVNGRIDSARLARQISGSPCIQGRTWGYDKHSLWVDKGCRADFSVRMR